MEHSAPIVIMRKGVLIQVLRRLVHGEDIGMVEGQPPQKTLQPPLDRLLRRSTQLARLFNEEFGALRPRLVLTQVLLRVLPPYSGGRIRAYALRALGFRIGAGSLFFGTPTITGPADLYRHLLIGAGCHINMGCFFDLEAPITIGDRVGIGHEVMILTSSHRIGAHARRADLALTRGAVVIEDGAWIGARSLILPGVTIGAGAVIAAGSVVTRDIDPDTLVNGKERISLARWR